VVGEPSKTTAREVDRRLRVIFANGTESNLLLRSLQRAFYDDPAARRLVSPKSGQLSFGGELEADDVESGTIYVLRSQSDEAVERIKDGTITNYVYDPKGARLVKVPSQKHANDQNPGGD